MSREKVLRNDRENHILNAMIISASRRTDIPAFFSAWFMERLRAGECSVPNPVNPAQASRIALTPEAVDAIVFWSKNPAPLLPRLDELDGAGYKYYFLYTLNDYPVALEPRTPALAKRLETFRAFAARLGAGRVVWRYDPIIFSRNLTPELHILSFSRIARELRGACDTVIISFLDWYARIREPMERIEKAAGDSFLLDPFQAPWFPAFARELARIAGANGMRVQSCCEPAALAACGVAAGPCIDPERIARVVGATVARRKDKGQRKLCLCAESRDIGEYGTCSHGCAYCYAARRRYAFPAQERG